MLTTGMWASTPLGPSSSISGRLPRDILLVDGWPETALPPPAGPVAVAELTLYRFRRRRLPYRPRKARQVGGCHLHLACFTKLRGTAVFSKSPAIGRTIAPRHRHRHDPKWFDQNRGEEREAPRTIPTRGRCRTCGGMATMLSLGSSHARSWNAPPLARYNRRLYDPSRQLRGSSRP